MMVDYSNFSTPASIGKKRRLHNLFGQSGKCILVPLDDSLISQDNIGLLNLQMKVNEIENAKPNGILCYQGTASLIRSLDLPMIINLSASTTNSTHTNKVLISSIENAIAYNASAVAVHINIASKYESEMLKNVGEVSDKCHYYGMPLLVIAYPRKENGQSDYNFEDIKTDNIDEYTKLVCHCVRIAFELGADIVKTKYTGTAESFENVILSAANRPVLIAGGSMLDDDALLDMIRGAINAGGAGVSIGRNVFNRPNSFEVIKKIKEIVYRTEVD